MLAARGVEFAYGNVQVLFGVDIEVGPGEIVALLGTNGAGKSTLLNVLAGLAPPAAGTITLAGEDVTTVDAAGMVARGVVLIQGGRAVFPDLSVIENIEVGLHPRRLSVPATRRRAAETLDGIPALAPLANRRAGTLSGGERQRLAIAKALVAEPAVLMIDELTLGLAPQVRDEVEGLVRASNAAGVTVILVEQSLDVAASLAPRAMFLEKGEVRFDGATAELFERGDLARAVFLGRRQR